MRKAQITLNFNSDFRKLIKKNFNIENREDIKALIFEFLQSGTDENISIKEQINLQKLEKLKEQRPHLLKKLIAEEKIKTWEAENLGLRPIITKEIEKNPHRKLTDNEVEIIVKHISLENTFDGWRITCFHCRLHVTYNDRLEALHESARHLSAVHGKVIIQK